jgi:tRNA-2-methylthio-N6-dimethylallyladenosine synthase
MNRHYTVEHYLGRMRKIKEFMPKCALSTDIIAGFPTETEEEHQMTLDVMREVRYDGAYMFKYSPRERTKAWKMGDDIPEDVKTRRLSEIIQLQQSIAKEINADTVGETLEVLVEGPSKRNANQWHGRTGTNKVVIFPHEDTRGYVIGDFVHAKITGSSSATLFGELV